MPQIEVPRRYRAPTGGLATLSVEGATVRACIEAADASHPGFGELVLDKEGALRGFVSLFVNGEKLERSGLDTPVGADDTISVLAAAAGG
jgi:molybdopterin synthase sulfur carrier subunit